MAFSLCIDDPIFIHDFQYNGDHVLMCRIGADSDSHMLYFAAVGLDPFPEHTPEYWFGVIERNVLIGCDNIILSGLKLANNIPVESRRVMLSVISMLTERLLMEVRPRRVARMTKDVYQSGKGIEKHEAISRVFQECGYTVTKCDSWHGKRAWLCELVG